MFKGRPLGPILWSGTRRLARRGAIARGRTAAEELRGRLEASEASVRAAFTRLEAASAVCDTLQQQLREVSPPWPSGMKASAATALWVNTHGLR